jgi:hypothetical protein
MTARRHDASALEVVVDLLALSKRAYIQPGCPQLYAHSM